MPPLTASAPHRMHVNAMAAARYRSGHAIFSKPAAFDSPHRDPAFLSRLDSDWIRASLIDVASHILRDFPDSPEASVELSWLAWKTSPMTLVDTAQRN